MTPPTLLTGNMAGSWADRQPFSWLRANPFVADLPLISPIALVAVIGTFVDPPGASPGVSRTYDILGAVLLIA